MTPEANHRLPAQRPYVIATLIGLVCGLLVTCRPAVAAPAADPESVERVRPTYHVQVSYSEELKPGSFSVVTTGRFYLVEVGAGSTPEQMDEMAPQIAAVIQQHIEEREK